MTIKFIFLVIAAVCAVASVACVWVGVRTPCSRELRIREKLEGFKIATILGWATAFFIVMSAVVR